MKRIPQNIIKINLGSAYQPKEGRSKADNNLIKFLVENPKAVKYTGDLRSEKIHFKYVWKMYAFVYKEQYHNNSYYEQIATYVQL